MTSERNLLSSPGNAWIATLALLFLYLPIATLVVLSFNQNDLMTIWSGFSIKWYLAVFDNTSILRAAKNSLIVASVATALAAVAATAAALGVVRTDAVHRGAVEGVLSLPLLVPVGHVMNALHTQMKAGQVPGYTSIYQFYKDGIHLNEAGSYLVGCTYFATLLQQSPVGLPTAPYGAIPPALAEIIQKTVWQVVTAHPDSGVTSR